VADPLPWHPRFSLQTAVHPRILLPCPPRCALNGSPKTRRCMIHLAQFPQTLEGLKDILRAMRAGFPDIVFSIQEQITEGDKVASRFEWTGTPALWTKRRRFTRTGPSARTGCRAGYWRANYGRRRSSVATDRNRRSACSSWGTCPFRTSGFPTDFTTNSRKPPQVHVPQTQDAQYPEHNCRQQVCKLLPSGA
jgi:hypothetical protein